MARRKNVSRRRKSHKKNSGGIPAWFWLLGGILIGLGVAVGLMFKGYLPELKQNTPAVDTASEETSSAALLNEDTDSATKKPRYDFFTVLPEMEVVVPDQELQRKAKRIPDPVPESATASAPETGENYILQVGSFRSANEAEQMKARLAMMGSTATIQTVTVNGDTWHRVRIGPFKGARKADEMRRMLSDNQIETMVVTGKP
jgi:cell division protein FtsN